MNSAVTGKLKGMRNRPGKHPPEGAGKEIRSDKSVISKTKNEPLPVGILTIDLDPVKELSRYPGYG